MERERLIALVTAAQRGDETALNELFSAFYNDVYYFALKTVKDEPLACDITQETFVEIIRTLQNLQEPAAFVKWMKQITYHQCTRYFKKKKDILVEEDENGATLFDTLQEEKAEFIPDEAVDKEDFRQTIMTMIDALSEEQRAAVMLFYFDELSIKQIAEIQGVSENTVKSRLNYARKGIKKSVEDYEEKHGVRLHSFGVLPILFWLFRDYFAQSTPATAAAVAEGVAAATGTTLAVAATTTATATATAATAATTATAVGIGAKIAALPVVAKIIAGVTAAAVAIGGTTAAVVLTKKGPAPATPPAVVEPVGGQEKDPPTLESRLSALPEAMYTLGDFATLDDLNAYRVFHWAEKRLTPVAQDKDEATMVYTYTYRVADLDALTDAYFGRRWDYAALTDTDYDYKQAEGTVSITYHGAFGDASPEITYTGHTAADDTHFTVTYEEARWDGARIFGTLQVEQIGDRLIVTAQSRTASPTLEGTIPEGMVYTTHDGTVLQAGEAFPATCTAGDKVLYGDYYYGYECLYAQNLTGGEEQVEWMMCKDFPLPMPADSGVTDEDIFGCWLPIVADQTKETYGPIAQSINGQPIGVLWMTFYGCKNLIAAPEIPAGVTSVSVAFYDCVSLTTAPVIPASVQRLAGTFHNCTSLTGDVVIHAAVDKSNFWYYYGTFANTAKDINLVGNIPEEDLMRIADEPTNRRITVNGKRVEFEEEEPVPVYYDPGRMTDSALTPEEVAVRALENARQVGGANYGEDGNFAIYATDYAASCFPDMDILGYGVTVDELCGLGWGYVDFYAELLGEEEDVRLYSASANVTLPMEEPQVAQKLLRQDIARIDAFLGGNAEYYVTADGDSIQQGEEALTNDALDRVMNGTDNAVLRILTARCFTVEEGPWAGQEYTFSFELHGKEWEGIYHYCIYMSVGF